MQRIAAYLPTDSEHQWAAGCSNCRYGLVAASDIVSSLPLHEGRAVQAAEDMLLFCDCRAGHLYRQFLRKVYATLSLTSRMNLREHVLAAMPAPSIRLEPAAQEQP